jgi:hypothetical protein
LASIPNWYGVESGGGRFTPNSATGGVPSPYSYSPQYNPSVAGAILNGGRYSAELGIFQIETDPFFSQLQPPPSTAFHATYCHVTSQTGAPVVTLSCKFF